jgi:hypothetical protein
MCSPLDKVPVEHLSAQDTRKGNPWRSIVKHSENHKVSILSMDPCRKATLADPFPFRFEHEISDHLALCATVTVVTSHIRDTGGSRRTAQSDTFL